MNLKKIRTHYGKRWCTSGALLCALVLSASLFSACVPITREASPAPTAASATSSLLVQLPNLAYPIDVAPDGVAQLADGAFSTPAAPGSATMITVALGEQQASGDLTGDGVADAATTLVADPGGSGTFVYLAAVLDEQGVSKVTPAVLLGDRITVTSVEIADQQIMVALLTRKEGEPMAAAPTEPMTQIYKITDGQLLLVG